MAVISSDNSTRVLKRTANLPSFAAFTVGLWVHKPSSGLFDALGFNLNESGFDQYLYLSESLDDVYLEVYDGSDFYSEESSSDVYAADAWYYIAITFNGTSYEVFVSTEDESLDMSSIVTLAAPAITEQLSIETYLRGASSGSALANLKIWTSVLTAEELRLERDAYAVTHTADLWASIPLDVAATGLVDTSGNGYDFTASGALSETTGPAVLDDDIDPPESPAAPSDFTVVANGHGRLDLSWVNNAEEALAIIVHRATGPMDSVAEEAFEGLATLDPEDTTYNNTTGLLGDQIYTYRIRTTHTLADPSEWVYAEGRTIPDYSVRFPSQPGSYLHTVEGLNPALIVTPVVNAAGVAWVRMTEHGSATIMAVMNSWDRAWIETPPPAENEWDLSNPVATYVWWGVIDGRLVLEVHDGRDPATAESKAPGLYFSAGAREAAITAFRAHYSYLHYGEASEVVIFTHEQPGHAGASLYYADYPLGYAVSPGHGFPSTFDRSQTVRVTGPALELNTWHRVGWRWYTVPGDPIDGNFESSMLELWVGCEKVAEEEWVNLQGTSEFIGLFGSGHGKYRDHFVGGMPASSLYGSSGVPIQIFDYKVWAEIGSPELSESLMESECDCVGNRPNIWWKLRSVDDVANFGTSLDDYYAKPVGTVSEGSGVPLNPCNVLTVAPPPTVIPPYPPPQDGPGLEEWPSTGSVRLRSSWLRRLRQAPHISNEQIRVQYHRFELDLQRGIARTGGRGAEPTIYLSWSDDGGHRWSNEYPFVLGPRGLEDDNRAVWRRLGQSRDRIFRVVVSDPVDWVLLQAFLDIVGGTS